MSIFPPIHLLIPPPANREQSLFVVSKRNHSFLVTLTLLGVIASTASAQGGETAPFESSQQPTVGATSGMRPPVTALPAFGSSAGTEILRHRAPAGNTCLAVTGYARPRIINLKVYDHVIKVMNSCAQRIAIRVCYYRTQDCISMEIPGGERKEAILGTLPSVNDFRFEFREQF